MILLKSFALLSLLLFSITSALAETWRITSLEWPPYSGADLPDQGLAIKELRDNLEKQGITLKVDFFPWKRAILKARGESYIGYYPAWPEEVEEGFTASKKVMDSQLYIFKNKDISERSTNMEYLFSKYKMGLVESYTYPNLISKYSNLYHLNVSYAKDELQLFTMLSAGRHSFAISDKKILDHYQSKKKFDNVHIVKKLMLKKLVIAVKNDKNTIKRLKLINYTLKSK